tara:strand:- start:744 stop:1076 length:333 start_codon:yes stop_codon:yes gene_type:complete
LSISEFPPAPIDYGGEARDWTRLIVRTLNNVLRGKQNNVIDVTLAVSATVTTISDARIAATTWPICIPTNTDAYAIPVPFLEDTARVNGSFILAHISDATTKTFKVVLVG